MSFYIFGCLRPHVNESLHRFHISQIVQDIQALPTCETSKLGMMLSRTVSGSPSHHLSRHILDLGLEHIHLPCNSGENSSVCRKKHCKDVHYRICCVALLKKLLGTFPLSFTSWSWSTTNCDSCVTKAIQLKEVQSTSSEWTKHHSTTSWL